MLCNYVYILIPGVGHVTASDCPQPLNVDLSVLSQGQGSASCSSLKFWGLIRGYKMPETREGGEAVTSFAAEVCEVIVSKEKEEEIMTTKINTALRNSMPRQQEVV